MVDQPIERLHTQLIGHLTGEELRELIRLLEKTRESMPDARE